ncbi:hypothetical protein RvY_07150 [Ramazzottius varieornatus]|uniref:Uncharacterized protein n=1 Tax=Ramazzottius varieornatus TaxID=947166 RepID=A0A1D1V3R5_RAMVA|nr:hypothetical protein RvY_07150 [Ramazzottius varieornatus]
MDSPVPPWPEEDAVAAGVDEDNPSQALEVLELVIEEKALDGIDIETEAVENNPPSESMTEPPPAAASGDRHSAGNMKLQPSETLVDVPVIRRNRPGTKVKDMYQWPDLPLEDMDTTLAVQQYIQQLIRRNPLDVDEILNMPPNQDEGVWKYEHLREFCMELNNLAVNLQCECTADTCTQMTATDQWIFLCAAHKQPRECSAIDYTRHTLDGAACLLNSNKYFPSRVDIKETSIAKLPSTCRRVYRIFSHAFFHHRPIFDAFEERTSLCRRFTAYVLKYNLMSAENLIVPVPGVHSPPPLQSPELKAGETEA